MGIILSIIAYFFVALIGVSQKFVSAGTPIVLTLFFQNIIFLLLILPSIKRNKFKIQQPQQYYVYAIRTLSGVACYACFFYIIKYIPVSEGLLLQHAASIWIPMISYLWLKVTMPKKLWWSIIIGFVGLIFILKPQGDITHLLLIIGISCGILQGISVVSIRRLTATEPTSRILFYYFLFGTIVTLPFAIKPLLSITSSDFFFLTLVGLNTFIAQYIIAISLRYAKARTLGPTCYFSILFSAILSYLFWHETLDHLVLMGMSLVILSGLLQIYLTHFSRKPHEIKA